MPDDTEITEAIIGAAYTVLNKLKPGLEEKLYERALIIQLGKQGLTCEDQKQFDVYYDEHHIGTLIPDLIVNKSIIVDPKVVTGFNENHIAQMLWLPQYHRPQNRVASQFQTRQAWHQTRLALRKI